MDTATIQQEGLLMEQHNVLHLHIRAWKLVAPVYMPGLLQYWADLADRPSTTTARGSSNPEDMELWLLSHLASASWSIVCQTGLADMKNLLQTAQCQDALNTV